MYTVRCSRYEVEGKKYRFSRSVSQGRFTYPVRWWPAVEIALERTLRVSSNEHSWQLKVPRNPTELRFHQIEAPRSPLVESLGPRRGVSGRSLPRETQNSRKKQKERERKERKEKKRRRGRRKEKENAIPHGIFVTVFPWQSSLLFPRSPAIPSSSSPPLRLTTLAEFI